MDIVLVLSSQQLSHLVSAARSRYLRSSRRVLHARILFVNLLAYACIVLGLLIRDARA
jgi:hypothetical protein